MNRLEVKYDVELDLNSRNSLKLINDRLKDDSEILEFGPANGRFTKHMHNNRNCCVDIVEYNPVSGQEAAQYARKAFIGEEKGDIEKYIWADELYGTKYDYIIFADVLEHLYNPIEVLERCKCFLKDNGAILISVPNIANNNIILSLLQDDFKYTPTGLLDETHIRFFTYKTLYALADSMDFHVSYADYVLAAIGGTEINVNLDMFLDKDISAICEHTFGDIYQLVFEFKQGKSNHVELTPIQKTFIPSIYYMKNAIYTENTCIRCSDICCNDNIYFARFNVENLIKENIIRFDPLEGCFCCFKLLNAHTDAGSCEITNSNAFMEKEGVLYFTTLDPSIVFCGDYSNASYIEFDYSLRLLDSKDISEITDDCKRLISLQRNEIDILRKKIVDMNLE